MYNDSPYTVHRNEGPYRYKWTDICEAHLWDNNSRREGQANNR